MEHHDWRAEWLALVVEDPLLDHRDDVVRDLEEVGRFDSRVRHGELREPVRADGLFVSKNSAGRDVGPFNIVRHHLEQAVDVASIESLVGLP